MADMLETTCMMAVISPGKGEWDMDPVNKPQY